MRSWGCRGNRFLWFGDHDWAFLADVDLIEPKRGPFDPRSELRRTVQREKYICCKCGEIELRRPAPFGL